MNIIFCKSQIERHLKTLKNKKNASVLLPQIRYVVQFFSSFSNENSKGQILGELKIIFNKKRLKMAI